MNWASFLNDNYTRCILLSTFATNLILAPFAATYAGSRGISTKFHRNKP